MDGSFLYLFVLLLAWETTLSGIKVNNETRSVEFGILLGIRISVGNIEALKKWIPCFQVL